MLAPTIRYCEGPQVFSVLCSARLFAVEVRVLGRGVEGRGKDVGGVSPEPWSRFDITEGATDGLELLFANL
jgi:hypothetical protein